MHVTSITLGIAVSVAISLWAALEIVAYRKSRKSSKKVRHQADEPHV
jgi:hypothetical protein